MTCWILYWDSLDGEKSPQYSLQPNESEVTPRFTFKKGYKYIFSNNLFLGYRYLQDSIELSFNNKTYVIETAENNQLDDFLILPKGYLVTISKENIILFDVKNAMQVKSKVNLSKDNKLIFLNQNAFISYGGSVITLWDFNLEKKESTIAFDQINVICSDNKMFSFSHNAGVGYLDIYNAKFEYITRIRSRPLSYLIEYMPRGLVVSADKNELRVLNLKTEKTVIENIHQQLIITHLKCMPYGNFFVTINEGEQTIKGKNEKIKFEIALWKLTPDFKIIKIASKDLDHAVKNLYTINDNMLSVILEDEKNNLKQITFKKSKKFALLKNPLLPFFLKTPHVVNDIVLDYLGADEQENRSQRSS